MKPIYSAVAVCLALGSVATANAATANPTTPVHDVELITGDHVLVSGQRLVLADTPHLTETRDGDTYIIPTKVLPYLGKTLDPNLFDVTALVRDGLSAPPLHVSYKPGAPTTPPPGVTADGKITSPQEFTASLRELATVASVQLAAPGAKPTAHPNFPMHTVTINAIGTDGKPAVASLGVLDLDDGRAYSEFSVTDGGQARISVPSGHYGLTAYFPSYDSAGTVTGLSVVDLSDIAVSGALTLTVDARSATSPFSVTTPRPATATAFQVHTLLQDGPKHWGLSMGFNTPGVPVPVMIAPGSAPSAGTRITDLVAHLESPASTADPYTYDVGFSEVGAVPADQHHTVTQDQLETLHASYHSDKPGQHEGLARQLQLPGIDLPEADLAPLTAPLKRTEYVGGTPGMIADDVVAANADTLSDPDFDGPRVVKPGTTRTVDWLREPLAPGIGQPTDVITNPIPNSNWGWGCGACRAGDVLDIGLTPAVDAVPEHSIYPDANEITGTHLVLSSGGHVYADTTQDITGAVTLPAGNAVYDLTYDQTLQPTWLAHSTSSHTEWTFSSAHSGARTVPSNWSCDLTGNVDQCSAVPLVTVNYRADKNTMAITFGHAPSAAPSPITKASAEISYDGGKTWLPTLLLRTGEGTYRAGWLGTPDSLRVSGTDAAGNSLTQTIVNAFN